MLIGGGVGLTPLMSVIRYLTDRGWPQDIYLLYCCRSTEDFVFREELEHLQRRHANLHVVATMTRAEGTTWMGPTGRLTKELLVQTVPDLPSRWIHLCGPPAMMDALRAILLDLGVPRGRIKTEAFGPVTAAAPGRRAGRDGRGPSGDDAHGDVYALREGGAAAAWDDRPRSCKASAS